MEKYWKAFIRVVKSVNKEDSYYAFGSQNVIEERLIIAEDKDQVKQILLEKYPQFFPENKIYSKETKDTAQFFYVVIFELYAWERKIIEDGISWTCSFCGQVHENTYLAKPRTNEKLFGDKMFCTSDQDYCLNQFKKEYYKDIDLPDDENFIRKDSPNYIYKITEKATGKCYVGKTRNAPFFRWWNHLTHSSSPFGQYLRTSKLSDWTFEVLEQLPAETPDQEVFKTESNYIQKFDSIKNGFNTLISAKIVVPPEPSPQMNFDFNQ